MNTKRLFVCAVVLLLVGWGITPGALAQEATEDDRGGQEHSLPADDLGFSRNRVDVWRIDCPSGTHHVRADVLCFTGGPHSNGEYKCEVVVFKGGRAYTIHYPVGNHQPDIVAVFGSGTYWIIIKKHYDGFVGYNSIQQCENSSNGFINHSFHGLTQDQ